ncbi:NDP-sugar synthase [Candidatus Peregrinibacteria bacterium]|nr:MAG: NDP-sugar synthase [Candidatus Peregrinibacteria bacterium]
MRAIILAGGFATRLWPLTEKTAKPLLSIGGKPIISFLLESLPEKIPVIVSTNAVFATDFEEWQTSFSDRDITIFSEDCLGEQKKTGALAAVALVISSLNIQEDVLVLAGDNLFFFDMEAFLRQANQYPLLAAYDIKDREEAKKFGVLVPKDNFSVAKFQEKPSDPESTLVSTGCLFFPKHLLSEIIRFSTEHNDNLGGIFEHFLKTGERVEYFPFHNPWFDIGSFPAFLEAHRHVVGENTVDEGAKKQGKNVFRGSVFLAKGSVLENTTIENSIIESNVTIRNASVRNSVIGKNATVTGVDISGIALREESFLSKE